MTNRNLTFFRVLFLKAARYAGVLFTSVRKVIAIIPRGKKNFAVRIANLLALCLGLIQLYALSFGIMSEMPRRVIFWTIITLILFILNPSESKKWGFLAKVWDAICILATVGSGFHIYQNWLRIAQAAGQTTNVDTIYAFMALVIVLEATRRVVGWVLVSIPLLLIVYSLYGASLPGILAHRGYSFTRLVTYFYRTTQGIFGIPTAVAASYVIIFVTFGTFLQKFGAGDMFTGLAYLVTKRTRGGPAKAAVVSSCLFGTLSGSSTGNVVTTGTFTIPLMKKAGYKPEFAAGVEAVSSCGGMLMPPVMGSAAFLMAEITGTPYSQIIIAAICPALLYYISLFSSIDFRTAKLRIGEGRESTGNNTGFDKSKLYHFIPLFLLIYFLLKGVTPTKAGIQATISVIIVSLIFGRDKTLKEKLLLTIDAIISGVKRIIPVAAACFCAGIIVSVIALTGLGFKINDILLTVSQGNLLITLMLTAIVSLILSTGLPTSAVYIVVALLMAPALIRLGVPLLSAHLFIFYYGMLSSLTPPVALGSYAAASIAGSNPNRTAIVGFKLSFAGFIIPFAFIYNPALLMIGSLSKIVLSLAIGIIMVISVASFMEGYLITHCRWWEKLILITVPLILLSPKGLYIGICIPLIAIVLISQLKRNKISVSKAHED